MFPMILTGQGAYVSDDTYNPVLRLNAEVLRRSAKFMKNIVLVDRFCFEDISLQLNNFRRSSLD